MPPIAVEQGIMLLMELGIEIFKAVQGRETPTAALKRVQRVIDAKIQIDADVDAAAAGTRDGG